MLFSECVRPSCFYCKDKLRTLSTLTCNTTGLHTAQYDGGTVSKINTSVVNKRIT